MPPLRSIMSEPAPTEASAADALGETGEAGVIDVGSNSVRLVVYRIDGRAMTPTHNEKVMAALGRGLMRTGRLSEPGADAAVRALARFRDVAGALGVTRLYGVATAAVREAADGAAFVERVARETGVQLRVLSGADEARLSALGVLCGAPEADGVVGDLGGSSLELVEVHKGHVGRGETFALGHLALGHLIGAEGFSYERVAAAADAALESWRPMNTAGALYAVGGVWRALGRIQIALSNHPLKVLHHHEMTRAEVLSVADTIRRQSKKSLERLEEAAAKRADSLPFGAVVLERLMVRGGFERVVLSSFGLREGVLLERMAPSVLAAHPLIAAAEAFAGPNKRARAFGKALADWIRPVFAQSAPIFSEERDAALRDAAARLADLGGALHPDQRGEIMFDLVLRAPLAAINHAERAFLAGCVHHRYTKSAPHAPAYLRLIDEDARRAALAVGAALRLGADLSARSEVLLGRFKLADAGDALVLSAPRDDAPLLSDQAGKRFETLAALLGKGARVETI